MMLSIHTKIINELFMLGVCCSMAACKQDPSIPPASQLQAIKDSVGLMAESISKNISTNGPTEWLKVFENSPDFFMANDGQIAFANYDSAANFINHVLLKSIKGIHLKWSNVRIEPLSQNFANFAANYQEDIVDFNSKTTGFIGYFTGIAKQTTQGWKLHNAHWSSLPVSKK